jgi:hypothetical protein
MKAKGRSPKMNTRSGPCSTFTNIFRPVFFVNRKGIVMKKVSVFSMKTLLIWTAMLIVLETISGMAVSRKVKEKKCVQ